MNETVTGVRPPKTVKTGPGENPRPSAKARAQMTDNAKESRANRKSAKAKDVSLTTPHKNELQNFKKWSAAKKGAYAESEATKALSRSGYTTLNIQYGANNGIDIFAFKPVTRNGVKSVDIIIGEVKYSHNGSIRLRYTGDYQQLSSQWLRLHLDRMRWNYKKNPIKYSYLKEPIELLTKNTKWVRFKVAVLNENGIMNWYDYRSN